MKFKQSVVAIAIIPLMTLAGCGAESDETESENTLASVSIEKSITKQEPVDGEQTISMTLKLNKRATNDATINFKLISGTATPDEDYRDQSGTIEIAKDAQSVDFDLIIKGDTLDEDEETFIIELDEPQGVTIASGKTTFTITDEDQTPLVTFETERAQVMEGSGTYFVALELTNGSQRSIDIPFSISGLATNEQDYKLITQSPITIEPTATGVSIKLEIEEDSIPEGGESIVITLGSPNNAEQGDITETTLIIPGPLALTDTGVTTHYDGVTYTATSANADYPLQDAEFGTDTGSTDNFDGKAGFSYTKKDRAGNALASNAEHYEYSYDGYRCVKDVVTGLTWESKTTAIVDLPDTSGSALKDEITEEVKISEKDGTPFKYEAAQRAWQNNQYVYYWMNTDKTTNGGYAGALGDKFPNSSYPINGQCAYPNVNMANHTKTTYCDTATYVKVANELALCGHKDWRLPLPSELRSIHDYGFDTPTDSSTVDYFKDELDRDYFTSTPAAGNDGSVWCLNGGNGSLQLCNKQYPASIRLVRGGVNND